MPEGDGGGEVAPRGGWARSRPARGEGILGGSRPRGGGVHVSGLAERMASRIEERVRPHLLPGERIEALALAVEDDPRRKFWVGFISRFAQAFVERPFYIVVTDRRFLALKPALTGEVEEVTISEPLPGVVVERFARRLLRTLLVVRPGPASRPLRFTFGPAWRARAAAIRAALRGGGGDQDARDGA